MLSSSAVLRSLRCGTPHTTAVMVVVPSVASCAANANAISHSSSFALYTSRRYQRTHRPRGRLGGSSSAPPTITNQRPGVLSSNPNAPPSRPPRLVGGRRRAVAYDDKASRTSGTGRGSHDESEPAYRACNAAPQRPSWWRWRGVTSSSGAPLNPLHQPEKFSWIRLFGGGKPHDTNKAAPGQRRYGTAGPIKRSAADASPDMLSRSTSRFLQAAQALHGRSKGERAAFTALLSDEQKLEVVNREIESKWWARLWYRPFRHVTDKRIRTMKRLLHLTLIICTCVSFLGCVYLYREEVRILESLTPEDKADYIYLVMRMRFSDLWNMGMGVLRKEDPLEALPAAARYHLVMEEARRLGWTSSVDWTLQMRQDHPNSALEEGDYLHVLYWTMIYVGSIASGGSSLFSTRMLGDPLEATKAAQKEAMENPPPPVGPMEVSKSKLSHFLR